MLYMSRECSFCCCHKSI